MEVIVRIYTGEDGRSHFEAITLRLAPNERGREFTPWEEATRIRFAQWPVGFFLDWHNAPQRQYGVILSGQMELGIGDGTTQRLGPGDVAFMEDLTGQGHTARVLSDLPLLLAAVPVGDNRQ
jgi:hypothetical protein